MKTASAKSFLTRSTHYNFCWRNNTLRMMPAMTANVTGTLWGLEDVYSRVMGVTHGFQ
jgi:hypothetical protein